MEVVGVAFAITIPLAALIFAAVSIRNQDMRSINEHLERELLRRDAQILKLDEELKECVRARDEYARERVIWLERLVQVEHDTATVAKRVTDAGLGGAVG